MNQVTSQVSGTKPYTAWFIATSFVFFQFFLQTSSSLMNDSWIRDFHLNTMQVSNLSAAFFYTYVLMQIPVGVLYDRYNAKTILLTAAITLTTGCFILSLTQSYKIAIMARFLMGIGSSFGYIGMLKVVINNFHPNRFSLMLGIGETIAMTIVTLGVIILGYFLRLHSWRIATFSCSIFAAILILAIKLYMQDSIPLKNQTHSFIDILKQIRTILMRKQVILCSMYGFFIFAIINAFTSLWGVSFITHTYPYSNAIAASMVSVVFIGLGIGAPLFGILAKKYHNPVKIMHISAIAISITTMLIILVPGIPKTWLFLLLFFSGLLCSGYVQCLSVIKDSVAPEVQATALATANMIIMAGAPILQLLIGALLNMNYLGLGNAVNYRFSLAIIPIGMVIAVILCRYIKAPAKPVVIRAL